MKRPVRSIEIFTMSALDLFVIAMGSFAVLMIILFPYYRVKKTPKPEPKPLAKNTLLFCVWDTRVQDYAQFYNEVLANIPQKPTNRAQERSDFWKHPGTGDPHPELIPAQPDYPVVGVSFDEATAFCKWLTEKEREAGTIGPEDTYRLPTDAEWTVAAGPDKYPWGNQWPPPPDATTYANLAGQESDNVYGLKRELGSMGFSDPFPGLAPAGSFQPNLRGLYDMGGNVTQWVDEWYRASLNTNEIFDSYPDFRNDKGGSTFRVTRGGNFHNSARAAILFATRYPNIPTDRDYDIGFRCVLDLKPRPGE